MSKASTIVIRSPKGGKALVNLKSKYIIRYEPSDAYKALQRKRKLIHVKYVMSMERTLEIYEKVVEGNSLYRFLGQFGIQ